MIRVTNGVQLAANMTATSTDIGSVVPETASPVVNPPSTPQEVKAMLQLEEAAAKQAVIARESALAAVTEARVVKDLLSSLGEWF